MGGYVLATGVLTITLASTSFRSHHLGAAVGALIGGAASIGWLAYVNFAINSNFKWVILGMALLWGCSLILFWIEKRSERHRPQHSRSRRPSAACRDPGGNNTSFHRRGAAGGIAS